MVPKWAEIDAAYHFNPMHWALTSNGVDIAWT
jgi:hypothetical protein